jgi:transposase-like protein
MGRAVAKADNEAMSMTADLAPAAHGLRGGAAASAMRRGRHRNAVLASWRCARAVELAAQGFTYRQIADELGYASRGTVHRIVRQALESRLAEGVDQLRKVELARLDALQAGLWEAAAGGDASAATTIVKIIQTRCRLLGLFDLPLQEGPLSSLSAVNRDRVVGDRANE